MKKKTVKRLVLAKETVRSLGTNEYEQVAGGHTEACPTSFVRYACWNECVSEGDSN